MSKKVLDNTTLAAEQNAPESVKYHEWRPIKTAPKDEVVLVYGLWAGEVNGPDETPGTYVAKFSGRSDYDGFWWTCQGTDAYAAWVKPTHWMPLPEPPTDK